MTIITKNITLRIFNHFQIDNHISNDFLFLLLCSFIALTTKIIRKINATKDDTNASKEKKIIQGEFGTKVLPIIMLIGNKIRLISATLPAVDFFIYITDYTFQGYLNILIYTPLTLQLILKLTL